MEVGTGDGGDDGAREGGRGTVMLAAVFARRDSSSDELGSGGRASGRWVFLVDDDAARTLAIMPRAARQRARGRCMVRTAQDAQSVGR